MIPTSLVIELISAFKNNDNILIDSCIKQIMQITENKKQNNLYNKLKKLYSKSSISSWDITRNYWIQNIKKEQNNLFERRISNVKLNNIILSDKNKFIFKEFIESYKKRKIFIEHGIESDNKILLYWPPGTWKTLFTYILWGELNLPILHVHLDTLISSYLWETWKNIREIFEQAKNEDCILFIDEFDSVAKKRDDLQELWELKRVVTVLLQNIDSLPNDVILIAATNHEHLLDSAIWRRFDYQINIDILDKKSVEKLINLYLSDVWEKVDIDILSFLAQWLSGSLIKQLLNKWLRSFIMNNKVWNINQYLIESLLSWTNLSKLDLKEKKNKILFKNIIQKLRAYDEKIYTFKKIEEITWIPHSTLNYNFNS